VNAIAGIFHLDSPADGGVLYALVGAGGTGASGSCHAEGRVAFAQGTGGVLRVDACGRVLLADARIDNAAELRRMLGTFAPASGGCPSRGIGQTAAQLDDTDAADLILAAWAEWGERCVDHLVGDFAFALWDAATQTLFCARDPMGVRPFYFHQSDGRFCFASETGTLLRLPGVPAEIDQERVVRFLLNTDAGREDTFYSGIRRLPAGHWLRRTPATLTLRRYWDPDSVGEVRYGSDEEYAAAFRDRFEEAVRSRLSHAGATAATLSGGLDSSSIVCTARNLIGDGAPLHTISLVFPDLPPDDLRRIDEREYMAAVTLEGGVVPHTVRGDRISPLGDVHAIVRTLNAPFAAPNLYLHWAMFAAAAGAGCSVFLDGFDGDSVVSHGLSRLDDLLAAGDWSGYDAEARAFAERRRTSPATVARSFGVPRLEWLAASGHWADWTRTAGELHRRFGFSRRQLFMEHGVRATRGGRRFLRGPASPAERIVRGRPEEDLPLASQPLSARAAHVAGLMQPAYQDTLELAYHCSRAFGIDARFPFFDRRLIEFCVGLPAEQKFRDGWTRLVMRNAMRGVLPEQVRTRADKGNLLPAFHRGLRNDDADALHALDVRRLEDMVDVELLTRMKTEYLEDGEAAGVDPLLLVRCATLSAWLEDRERSAPARMVGERASVGVSPQLQT
jgi:asparagine synthase (glutamine-hydrolysing)